MDAICSNEIMNKIYKFVKIRAIRWFFDPTLQLLNVFPWISNTSRLELDDLGTKGKKVVFVRIGLYLLITLIVIAVVLLLR